MSETNLDQQVSFYVNGERHRVAGGRADQLLVDYLRSPAVGLTGTKHSCGQGGCGSCTVMLSTPRDDGTHEHRAINSCLRPLWMLDGADITTVEGTGSVATGLSPEQYEIASCNGSQCGYCTPGFVMNLYSLRRQYSARTKRQIEEAFDGNICRCTGFRPILEAASHFASDADTDAAGDGVCLVDPSLMLNVVDAEPPLAALSRPTSLAVEVGEATYLRPLTEATLHELLARYAGQDIAIVAGHTSVGIPDLVRPSASVHIDVSQIESLRKVDVSDDALHIGAATRYSDLLDRLDALTSSVSVSKAQRRSLRMLRYMAHRTAGTVVRNVATVGGNTMLVAFNATEPGTPFPSDLVTALVTLNASVTLLEDGQQQQVSLDRFLQRCRNTPSYCQRIVLIGYDVPLTRPREFAYVSKVATREVNAHAIVNSGLWLRFAAKRPGQKKKRIAKSRIVIGALGPLPLRATRTEAVLKGKRWNQRTVRIACHTLQQEVKAFQSALPTWYTDLPDHGSSLRYKRRLAVQQLRKHLIRMGRKRNYRIFGSADAVVDLYDRPLVSGSQHYAKPQGNTLGQPIIKLSAFEQATGQAQYVHDMSVPRGGAYGAFVTSTQALAEYHYSLPERVGQVSLSELQNYLGQKYPQTFVDVIDHSDIPKGGTLGKGWNRDDDPWFAAGSVANWGQSIALVCATTKAAAETIAAEVGAGCITYHSTQRPLLSIEEAISAQQFFPEYEQDPSHNISSPEFASNDGWVKQQGKLNYDGLPCLIVAGGQSTGAQKQFYMEPQSCLVTPKEGRKLLVSTLR